MVLIGLLASLSLNAQSSRYGRRRNSQQNMKQKNTRQTSQQQKTETQQRLQKTSDLKEEKKVNTKQKDRDLSRRFDSRKPVLTESAVKKILEDRIQKGLLERELAPNIKSSTTETFLSQSECSSILSEYKNLVNNFELVEVTRIKPEWYKRYGEELVKFQKIVDALYFSIRRSSNEQYEDAVDKFQKQQEACLKFLKEKPPKISKNEYEALFVKNTKIRQQNYLKRLQQEREAAAKRRQEYIRQQNEMHQYLKEHPEFLKEHPEILKEHPELQKLYPNAMTKTSKTASSKDDKTKAKKSRK